MTIQESIFVLTNTVLTVVAAIFLFEMFGWKDFRLFAPIVLMFTFFFIARQRVFLLALMLVGNLVLLCCFLGTYRETMIDAFPKTQTAIEVFSDEIAPIIIYDKNRDGWGNTLLVPMQIAFYHQMLGLPAGIGISFFTSHDKLSNIKSRYILLDKSSYEVLKDRASLDFKLTTAIGDLYINRDSESRK